ncbi:MAG: transporter substrate-binding domain-containing protein, partial [Treponema sp.]|nr:transporter substrate-binding domain-containing protein [Treponema sp.]
MRVENRTIYLLFLLLISFLLFSCANPSEDKSSNNSFFNLYPYERFQDIPEITAAEIRAIEEFQKQGISFVYGMTPSTEAFYSLDNTVRGFSALFCQWLTGFFGIQFIPVISEWDDLVYGLESGEIDFSGDLTLTEKTRETYFMTSAIVQRTLTFDSDHDVVSEEILPVIFSPVSMTTRKKELEPFITVIQKVIYGGGLRFLTSMYNQGYREYLTHKFFSRLTEEERIFMQSSPVVRFAAETDNFPVCFFNSQEKQWQGIAFDVMNEIENLTGLTFQIANINNQMIPWTDMARMLESGEVSMLTELIRTNEREGRFLWPRTVIAKNNFALISKLAHPNITINEILSVRVGLPRGTAYTEIFRSWFPYHDYT